MNVKQEDIDEAREKVINGEWAKAAKENLFLIEGMWNEIRRLRDEQNLG